MAWGREETQEIMAYTHALVRTPAPTFALGLTQSTAGAPHFATALLQHRRYCEALVECGLQLTALPSDPAFPDGTFVEDTALLFPEVAVLTRPGAPSRRGETVSTLTALQGFFERIDTIEAPGTVDGGDICVADQHVFIGISARTNEVGAAQLTQILRSHGYAISLIDIRGSETLLHLKSGLTYLGDRLMIVSSDAPSTAVIADFDILELAPEENYAANCLNINNQILIAAGYPRLAAALAQRGRRTLALEMSEFRKMDGGLTCLSLRF
jgi:dimethylargininase